MSAGNGIRVPLAEQYGLLATELSLQPLSVYSFSLKKYFMCVSVCLCLCMSLLMSWCQWVSEEWERPPDAGVIGDYVLACGCWELNNH